MLKRLRKDEKGFTLMEIVIVIVILGILALLAIPRLLGFTDQANLANDKEYAAIVGRAAELYWASHEQKFNGITDLTSGTNELVDSPANSLKYFPAGTVVAVEVSSGATTVSGSAITLDKGVARVQFQNASSVVLLEYSTQAGYTKLP